MGGWRLGECTGREEGGVMQGDSRPGPEAEVGGWLEEVVPLWDSQRSSGSAGY